MPTPKAKYKVWDKVSTMDWYWVIIQRTYIWKKEAEESWRQEPWWEYEVEIIEPYITTCMEDDLF